MNVSGVGIGVGGLTRIISRVDLYRFRDCQAAVNFTVRLFGADGETIRFQLVLVEMAGRYNFAIMVP